MKDKSSIEDIFHEYLEFYDKEIDNQIRFKDFLAKTTSRDLYNRKNFDGHITASAFIINQERDKILLIEHKTLRRWLQPGGHVEPSDTSLLDASLREVEEEVNIQRSVLNLISQGGSPHMPFDIDSHFIPKNLSKNEEGHYHHDFRYLFEYAGTEEIEINVEEVSNSKWIKVSKLKNDPTFMLVVNKLRLL